MQKIIYLVSLLSLQTLTRRTAGRKFPACFLTNPAELINIAMDSQWNGVQALPLREMTGKEDHVVTFEDAWEPSAGTLGNLNRPFCWSMFAPHDEREKIMAGWRSQGALRIGHSFHETGVDLVEVSKEMRIASRWSLQTACEDRHLPLVLDSKHLLENDPRWSVIKGSSAEIVGQLMEFSPFISNVIHLQPTLPLEEFLRQPLDDPSARLFTRLLDFLIRKNTGDDPITVVAEYNPGPEGFLDWRKSRGYAVGMRQVVEDLCRRVLDEI